MEYTYLLINFCIIIVPLIFSFEKKIRFISHWKAFLPAVIIIGSVFIVWDLIFTGIGVWSFNKDYILGLYIINLPVEEILFFITVPYSCLFIYSVINYYLPSRIDNKIYNVIYLLLSSFLIIIGIIQYDRLYTVVTFLSLGLLIPISIYLFKYQKLKLFTITFLLSMIPFLIFNGLLTSIPVVIYNNNENIALRLFTIPLEDIFYGMLLIFSNILLYETYLKKSF